MNSFETQGKIVEIFAEQQVSEKFRKREFAVEIPDGAYAQTAKFQLTQDKCSLLDQYQVGQEVKVHFNLSGKPFTKNGTTMYFTNLQAWRLEAANSSPVTARAEVQEDDNDSLPF
jgi:single-strand DNA-binding protein